MEIIKTLKLLWFIWKLRKETKYILDTWKIPMCSCKDYFKTWNCKHLDKLRLDFKKFIWK